jgi:hypothetical protein
VSRSDHGELLPTWEQLINGVGVGFSGRPQWRFGTASPRHVRAWSDDWEERWAELVRELQADAAMPWREAWAWTALATACAAAASSAAGLLR